MVRIQGLEFRVEVESTLGSTPPCCSLPLSLYIYVYIHTSFFPCLIPSPPFFPHLTPPLLLISHSPSIRLLTHSVLLCSWIC